MISRALQSKRGTFLSASLLVFCVGALACGPRGGAQTQAPAEDPLAGDPEIDLNASSNSQGSAKVYAPVEKLIASQKYEEAVELADQLLGEHPDEPGLHYTRGAALQRLGRIDEARSSLAKAVEVDPKFAPAYTALAREEAFGQGDLAKGRGYAEKAVASDPQSVEAKLVLAMILHDSGEVDDALALLEDARSQAKATPELLGELARLYAAKERWSEATAALTEAIELQPGIESVPARLLLGRMFLVQGEIGAATSAFDGAIKGAPEDWDVRLAVVRAYLSANQPDAALVHAQKAVEALPQAAPARIALGRVLAEQKKFDGADGAFAQFDAALKAEPDSVAAHFHRSLALVQAGRCKEARKVAKALDPEHLSAANAAELKDSLASCR